MRKLFALLSLCLLLTGCSGENQTMQQALDFRASLLEAGGCTFQADLTANYDDQVFRFKLACNYDTQNGATMTILEPQTLSGISASISGDGARLEYDGVSLALGKLAGGRVAPMALPQLLGKSWCEAYVYAAGQEGEACRLTYKLGYEADELTIDTWLTAAGQPTRCELAYQGEMLLSADLSDFQLKR